MGMQAVSLTGTGRGPPKAVTDTYMQIVCLGWDQALLTSMRECRQSAWLGWDQGLRVLTLKPESAGSQPDWDGVRVGIVV